MICLTDSFFVLAFSRENPRCSEDEEHQSREKGTNDNDGRGANGAISNQRKRKKKPGKSSSILHRFKGFCLTDSFVGLLSSVTWTWG